MDENPEVRQNHDKDEHLKTLIDAHVALDSALKNILLGRERLQNAIDKYEERKADGPAKHI